MRTSEFVYLFRGAGFADALRRATDPNFPVVERPEPSPAGAPGGKRGRESRSHVTAHLGSEKQSYNPASAPVPEPPAAGPPIRSQRAPKMDPKAKHIGSHQPNTALLG